MSFALGIDVGVRASGAALVEFNRKKFVGVECAFVPNPPRWMSWYDSIARMMDDIYLLLDEFDIDHVYAETPQLMGGAKGKSAARRGDIIHLAHHHGMCHSLALAASATFHPVSIPVWKGTLPDETVWNRVKRIATHDAAGNEIHTHALDAVGIAVCGHLKTDMRDKLWAAKK